MTGPLKIHLEALTWKIPLAAGGELKRDSTFYYPKLLCTASVWSSFVFVNLTAKPS